MVAGGGALNTAAEAEDRHGAHVRGCDDVGLAEGLHEDVRHDGRRPEGVNSHYDNVSNHRVTPQQLPFAKFSRSCINGGE